MSFPTNTGVFGSGNTGQQPAASSIFGSGTSNTNTKPAGSIFASTNTGGSLFGNANNTSSTTPGAGIFGATSNTSTPGSALFGGNTSSTANTAGSGLLGAGSSNPSGGLGGSLFGGQKTTGTTPGTSTLASSSTSTNATSGGLFGATGTDASKPSTTTNPLFGGSSAFSSSKPSDSAAKPPASNFFSLGGASGTTPAGGTTAGNGLFNLPKPGTTTGSSTIPATNTTSTPGTSSGSTGTNLFGGGGVFNNPPATSINTPSAGTPSLFSLGGEKKDGQTTSTPLGSGLFGAPKPDDAKKDGTQATPQPFSLFGTTSKPEEKKDGAAASTTTTEKKDTPAITALSVAVVPPSMLRGKTLEEIINKWTADLETNVREFNRFGEEVAVWDRALIENGNNIAALYSHVLAAEKQQNDINEALNHIEQQQRDLASTLDAYEKISQEILGGQSSTLRTLDTGPADNERDKNYMLATDLHTHLDDLSGSLVQMIDSVNALSISSKSDDAGDDPMAQITQILSSHLESLQWIDSAVREVESKTSEVEKRINLSGHSLAGGGVKSRGSRT